MKHINYKFSGSSTDFYFAYGISHLKKITDPNATVLITDENVYKAHTKRFRGWNTIVLKPGEEFKVQATADALIEKLIDMEADRKTTLVGVGGGVITDITGYVASVYMRGLRFGFIPTSILALVDASIGGKNGLDVGVYKNMVGVIRQPSFILHDMVFLNSLPQQEWENGFAEIIKHACIKDAVMFAELERNSLKTYQGRQKSICEIIRKNALIKTRVVQKDEFEKGERRLLNFGHTLGHALETQYELLHGQAISIGMTYACHISAQLAGFKQTEKVIAVLEKYNLPTYASFDKQKVFDVLKMDKKRERKEMNYVLLERIGKGVVKSISLVQLGKIIQDL
ncbi:MAG TPA: 3-dehydroquinate synthase [Chitinophagaceae bacterium]|nr:3-dehydroquinate synthase [Chitinophagaceae bacterium]HQV84610.1 3-dehydroquinate synthase [Chitinophagaceae bacterium]HQX72354.1 3-dehydroquinate synthase [Chitinophagaceae bacterium]HQZ73795.1 3-dehydroquinate synthase [Chitinophagaceae bacterium]